MPPSAPCESQALHAASSARLPVLALCHAAAAWVWRMLLNVVHAQEWLHVLLR